MRGWLSIVDLSETEDESLSDLSVLMGEISRPDWEASAQQASLTNTLTALTLAGVPVMNTTVDDAVESLRRVVEATAQEFAEVQVVLRP